MSTSQDIMGLLQNVWTKLQALPQDHPLTQAAFSIIVLFFLTFLTMVVAGCVYGCCGCCSPGTKKRVSTETWEP
ncbi:small integral membrane protein 5 isoform X1 [Danio rerio]|uniref:Si:ch211-110e21.3 n=1 Tax=Danio rerio TaxID=7955 RepID=E7FCK4_DANRE|nr:small integral membrane protein 5 [Danio rerio]NP_001289544.1 small integral membrane protein 5 [Danio rerio]|eukprot:NP_001156477.1 small integral membrane protein 5 [Danio rerio]